MKPVTTPGNRRVNERRDGPQPSVEDLVAQVGTVFNAAGIAMASSKIRRLVRTYKYRPEANGYVFADYLINALALTVMQRQQIRDELARVLAYADPVGELATNNVMKERK